MDQFDARVCPGCDEEFQPSSRHRLCPKCRSKKAERYSICPCGNRKQKNSQVCRVCSGAGQAREGNNNWRGGSFRTKKGYVQRSVPGHPRGDERNTSYVPEHVLVMEEHLGRYLVSGENVHHKNGQRDDNRIENLELWSTRQPSGQRARDKLAWAREIIELYGISEDKL